MLALVVSGNSEEGDDSQVSGGGVVDILHSTPGKKLNKTNQNPFEWKFEDGEEDRGLLHFLLGVQWIGPTRSLRVNHVYDVCFRREPEKRSYQISEKDYQTKFIRFSREQAVEEYEAKTIGTYKLDVRFNLLYAMLQPVKALLGVQDLNTVLTSMVKEAVNNTTSAQQPEYFLQGEVAHKLELVTAVASIRTAVLENIGIDITVVNLFGLDVDEKTRQLLELEETTNRENAAAISRAKRAQLETIIAAEGKKQAQLMDNEAQADRVEKVIRPLGDIPSAVPLRWAEAYEKNTTVTTLMIGGKPVPILIEAKGKPKNSIQPILDD